MHKEETYKNFVISWDDPPSTTGEKHVTVASLHRGLVISMKEILGETGALQISGSTFEEAIKRAKAFIDKVPQ